MPPQAVAGLFKTKPLRIRATYELNTGHPLAGRRYRSIDGLKVSVGGNDTVVQLRTKRGGFHQFRIYHGQRIDLEHGNTNSGAWLKTVHAAIHHIEPIAESRREEILSSFGKGLVRK